MFCKKCGYELSENDDFCPKCGTSSTSSEQSPSYTTKEIILRTICFVIALFGLLTFAFNFAGISFSGVDVGLTLFQVMDTNSIVGFIFEVFNIPGTVIVAVLWILFAITVIGLVLSLLPFVNFFTKKNVLKLKNANKSFKYTALPALIISFLLMAIAVAGLTIVKGILGSLSDQLDGFLATLVAVATGYARSIIYTSLYIPFIIELCLTILYIFVAKLLNPVPDKVAEHVEAEPKENGEEKMKAVAEAEHKVIAEAEPKENILEELAAVTEEESEAVIEAEVKTEAVTETKAEPEAVTKAEETIA